MMSVRFIERSSNELGKKGVREKLREKPWKPLEENFSLIDDR